MGLAAFNRARRIKAEAAKKAKPAAGTPKTDDAGTEDLSALTVKVLKDRAAKMAPPVVTKGMNKAAIIKAILAG